MLFKTHQPFVFRCGNPYQGAVDKPMYLDGVEVSGSPSSRDIPVKLVFSPEFVKLHNLSILRSGDMFRVSGLFEYQVYQGTNKRGEFFTAVSLRVLQLDDFVPVRLEVIDLK